jgi:dolichyl-phosphate beta-glucosyltransferase
MNEEMKLTVVIPAFDESGRIEDSLDRVLSYLRGADSVKDGFEIIVVDDGSTDETRGRIAAMAERNPEIRIVAYDENQGKGYAVRQGILASKGKCVLISDADLSAPIEDLPLLTDALEHGFDIAVGSRAMPGSVLTERQPRYRELGGKALNLPIRLLAVPGIHDTQCGFKLFRGDAARRIFAKCTLNRYSFDVEALYLARKMGCSMAEVPIHWGHREGSKVRPFADGFKILLDLARLRLRKYDLR